MFAYIYVCMYIVCAMNVVMYMYVCSYSTYGYTYMDVLFFLFLLHSVYMHAYISSVYSLHSKS